MCVFIVKCSFSFGSANLIVVLVPCPILLGSATFFVRDSARRSTLRPLLPSWKVASWTFLVFAVAVTCHVATQRRSFDLNLLFDASIVIAGIVIPVSH